MMICSDSAAVLSSVKTEKGDLFCGDDSAVNGIGEDGSGDKLLLCFRPCGCGG